MAKENGDRKKSSRGDLKRISEVSVHMTVVGLGIYPAI